MTVRTKIVSEFDSSCCEGQFDARCTRKSVLAVMLNHDNGTFAHDFPDLRFVLDTAQYGTGHYGWSISTETLQPDTDSDINVVLLSWDGNVNPIGCAECTLRRSAF